MNKISKKVHFDDNITIYYYNTYTHPFYKLVFLKNKLLKYLHLNKFIQKN